MIRFTDHAIDRYIERVRPALDRDQARTELERLTQQIGHVAQTAPDWCDGGEAHCFLTLGDDVCLPLHRKANCLLALTCLIHDGLTRKTKERRKRRQERRRLRRQERERPAIYGEGRRPSMPPPAPEAA